MVRQVGEVEECSGEGMWWRRVEVKQCGGVSGESVWLRNNVEMQEGILI